MSRLRASLNERPVKSRILCEQIIGRGTRLCPDINKSKFVVFDCFDGTLIQYFRNVSRFDLEPPAKTPLTLPEVIKNIWQNVDRDSCGLDRLLLHPRPALANSVEN